MKNSKKGFTLIELLAVIVILAIIALIAAPIVINIIEESKQSAQLRSADSYLDAVEQSLGQAILKDKNIPNSTYDILSSGNICLGYDNDNKCNDELSVKIDGDKPNGGTITITNGKITNISLVFDDKTIVKNEQGKFEYQSVPTPKSFAEDDWDTIVANLSAYSVGETKEIALTGFTNADEDSKGLYTIRIANTSSPSECNTPGFSQTACGFVIEFVDIITRQKMYSYSTNKGGYPATIMYNFIKNDIYNALPEDLRDKIIYTTVVSGHGKNSGETNFVTEDKLYLLSTKEIWEQGDSNKISYDMARDLTRQLDYYKNFENPNGSIGVTTDNDSDAALKRYKGLGGTWYLRSANAYENYKYYIVTAGGDWNSNDASYESGVAVAFRIG